MHDVRHSRTAGDLAIPARPLSMTPLELLPRTSWWKLFIDRKFHSRRNIGLSEQELWTPSLLFDRQKSPGFHAVMMRVFRSDLGLPEALGVRLDFAAYERLYHAVSDDVGGIANRGCSGTDATNGATHFPPGYAPGPMARTELLQERVGCWNLFTRERTGSTATDKVTMMYYGTPAAWRCHVGYKVAEGPVLANAFFDRYYSEIDHAAGALARCTAIVRLVRALHVYHFFQDANGRLNTMVVLNKLLIENGFPPSILPDPGIFGGGKTLAQLTRAVARGMRPVLLEMEAQLRLAPLDLAT